MPALEIHHININNGDCTLILLDNSPVGAPAPNYTHSVLIDGGQDNPTRELDPYLTFIGQTYLDTVILSHYHNDHYRGLEGLANNLFRTIAYVDCGGYNLGAGNPINPPQPPPAGAPAPPGGYNPPPSVGAAWPAKLTTASIGGGVVFPPTITARIPPKNFDGDIWHTINIGALGGGGGGLPLINVDLQCIIGSAYEIAGAPGSGLVSARNIGGYSKNNFCLGWILTFGQFRYFTAGDMGGNNTGSYTDQETPLITNIGGNPSPLDAYFPNANPFNNATPLPAPNYPGHMCAWKASHHGSNESNNQAFINKLKPAATFTSAGAKRSWHLPSVGFINRLAGNASLNTGARTLGTTEGFFFTNLYDFGGAGGANNSQTIAINNFGPGSPQRMNAQGIPITTILEYGSNNPTPGSSTTAEGFMIRVPYTTNAAPISRNPIENPTHCSVFDVYRTNIGGWGASTPGKRLEGGFECHCI